MEPIAALSLAANIVQFTELVTKLFLETQEIYKSAANGPEGVQTLSDVSEELYILSRRINATESVVSRLTVDGDKTMWKSFVVALRSVQKQKDVDELRYKVRDLQSRLGLHMQQALSDQQSALSKAFQNLKEDNRRIELDRNIKLDEVKEALSKSIQDLRGSHTEAMSQQLQQLHQLHDAMINAADHSNLIAAEQRILMSLRFQEIKRRRDAVFTAHKTTFEWIFKDTINLRDGKIAIGFKEWLEKQSGHFWLEGKAGSGKSTLMKFISTHADTEMYLSAWAANANKRLVTTSFFFWHSGSPLEKSQEGLLRSLLFGILAKCPDLIKLVCANRLKALDHEIEEWTREELLETLRQLANQVLPVRFCFFIDGLDEYDGDHDDLIETVKALISLPNIKICLSSRPWPQFRDAFGKNQDQVLRLQDLTRDDIRSYVTDKFLGHEVFKQVADTNPEYKNLIEQVVNNAEGVFLWVYLVVRSLLDGIRNRDLLSDLKLRLEQLPQNLEDFFKHMLSQIDKTYKTRSMKAFQIALSAPEPPLLAFYSILDILEDRPGRVCGDVSQKIALEEIEKMEEIMKRRLDERCKGLLEISTDQSQRSIGLRDSVVFLHRSVRDFLNTKDMQNNFKEEFDEGYNVNLASCQAILETISIVGRDETALASIELLPQLFYHVREIESRHSSSELISNAHSILDRAESLLRRSKKWKWWRKNTAFVGTAIEWDLCGYVKRRVDAQPALLQTRQRPLLDYALRPSKVRYLNDILRSPEMVSILLKSNANPNSKFKDFTIWAHFLETIIAQPELANQADIIDIAKKLLQNGADLNAVVTRKEKEFIVKPTSTGRASDLHRRKRQGTIIIEKRANEVLQEIYDPERYILIKNAQVQKESRWTVSFFT
ncbi:hypothetical protein CFAM422_000001 [Trichoderma lentiforme]|uniref:NACHT domain-containing protein n=1 Tax=Trichoderma lentiforme TaxID=1567552 RepID=A0A9P4XRX0_9HYPO|nr:hypothetical protein CFAM422_000001 [Trichoderma lentiforme]